MAQINPHFLNNVLQSIGSVALEKDIIEVYEATTTLAKMLRYSIKGADEMPLEQEIQNVSNYLFIQKFRFENKLEYSFEVDEKLNNYVLPKLTIQPLVENAVVHGLEGKKYGGKVKICCFQEGEKVCIYVMDNGIGMDHAQLTSIFEQFRQNDKQIEIETGKIGLINVYQRLRLTYGKSFTINIESTPGIGTKLMLCLPFNAEE